MREDEIKELLIQLLIGPNPFCDRPYISGAETFYCRRKPDHDGTCGDYERPT